MPLGHVSVLGRGFFGLLPMSKRPLPCVPSGPDPGGVQPWPVIGYVPPAPEVQGATLNKVEPAASDPGDWRSALEMAVKAVPGGGR